MADRARGRGNGQGQWFRNPLGRNRNNDDDDDIDQDNSHDDYEGNDNNNNNNNNHYVPSTTDALRDMITPLFGGGDDQLVRMTISSQSQTSRPWTLRHHIPWRHDDGGYTTRV